jgi:hypothetical protein
MFSNTLDKFRKMLSITKTYFLNGFRAKSLYFTKVPILISIPALLVRLPLLFLPNPGRDEAAYFYWSHFPEPAYALTMQAVVAIFRQFPIPDMIAMRLPSLIMGILVLFLFDKLLMIRGIKRKPRLIVLSALAFCPWQSNFGVILNPDNFLFASMLLWLIAFSKKQYFLVILSSALAVYSKPIGLLVIPPTIFVLFTEQDLNKQKLSGYYSVLLILILTYLMSLRFEMFQSFLEFGQLDGEISLIELFSIQFLLLLAAGGPLLLYFSSNGLIARIRKGMFEQPEDKAALILSLFMLVVFGGALIFNNQVKYNWLLPALFILWPKQPMKISKPVLIVGLMLTIVPGILQNMVKSRPQIISHLEEKFPLIKSSFVFREGKRDFKISMSKSWSEHVLEYQSMDEFCNQVIQFWENEKNTTDHPFWIISDDYGLTSQLLFNMKGNQAKMILPGDGVFNGTIPDLNDINLADNAMILVVKSDGENVWDRLYSIGAKRTILHPISNKPVLVGIPDGLPMTAKENEQSFFGVLDEYLLSLFPKSAFGRE